MSWTGISFMAISVPVPKDLSGIKTKVALNLTKRQLICFGGAAMVGIPLYLALRGIAVTEAAAMAMVAAMLPFFFVAMFRKDGFPAEKYLYLIIRQKLLMPGIRRYRSEDVFRGMEKMERIRKEVEKLEGKRKRHVEKPCKKEGQGIKAGHKT